MYDVSNDRATIPFAHHSRETQQAIYSILPQAGSFHSFSLETSRNRNMLTSWSYSGLLGEPSSQ
jgi:hypothetical protein